MIRILPFISLLVARLCLRVSKILKEEGKIVSSIKFDSKVSGEEVRNMTMNWGYTSANVSRQPEVIISDNESLATIARVLNPVFNVVSMIAGAATAIAILAWVAIILKIWV